jgi:hypothetical protein
MQGSVSEVMKEYGVGDDEQLCHRLQVTRSILRVNSDEVDYLHSLHVILLPDPDTAASCLRLCRDD